VDLLRLRSFVESARLGSFAAAADALGYTAPAVSQHVAHLENELQCELLMRGARGVELTPPGRELLGRAERLLADVQVATLAVREAAGHVRSLRVGAFPSAAQRLVPEALARLRAQHTDLELSLMHFEPPDGLAQLASGQVDVVLTHRYPGVTWGLPTGVRTVLLAEDPLDLMVPADHPLATHREVDIEHVRDEVFISGTPEDPNRVALATMCAAAGFTPRVSFETIDYTATANLVTHGLGVAVVPRLAWPVDAAGVVRVPIRPHDKRGTTRQILFAQRTGRTPSLVGELRMHLMRAW
jgi:DNA-binding transcriptional LysR family regulator